jgi:hypothetical protein
MHSEPQISLQEIDPPLSFSGDAIIHRVCTDQFIRAKFSDKLALIKVEPARLRLHCRSNEDNRVVTQL